MLFNTIEEFQQYIPVNKSFRLDRLTTFITQVEEAFIKPILGKALFDRLQAAYALSATDPLHLALLAKVQLPIAFLAWHRYVPFGQVQFSDAGFRNAQGDDFRSASKWQIEKIEAGSLNDGYTFLEQLLQFLEENALDYPDWDYADNHQFLISNAKAFNQEVFINESRLIFLKMLPQMKRIERHIRSQISKAQFNDLKAKVADPTTHWTDLEAELLEYIQNAVAHLTYAASIRSLPLEVDGKQLTIFNNQFLSDFDPKVQPDVDLLAYLERQHREQGEESLQAAIYLMHMNIDDFPLYRDSNCYTPPEEELDIDIQDSGFFIT
ncbi:MAG: DUF6712 family protein [Flammeovirgaceae bacterium]